MGEPKGIKYRALARTIYVISQHRLLSQISTRIAGRQ